MAKRKRLSRVALKRRQEKVRFLVASSVLFVLLIGGVIYLLHQPYMRMQSILVTTSVENKEILFKQAVEDFYSRGRLLVPKDSAITPSLQSLRKSLRHTFPYIKEIRIQRHGWYRATLVIEEYTHTDTLFSSGRYMKISPEGYLFDYTPEPQGRIYIHSNSLKLRDYVLEREQFIAFREFIDDLSVLGIEVTMISIHNDLETVLGLDNGVEIIIRNGGVYDAYRETLREILRYKEFGYDFSEGVFLKPVAYINLRYGDRVFYCYTTDPCLDNYELIMGDT